jgi:hypothetical protein
MRAASSAPFAHTSARHGPGRASPLVRSALMSTRTQNRCSNGRPRDPGRPPDRGPFAQARRLVRFTSTSRLGMVRATGRRASYLGVRLCFALGALSRCLVGRRGPAGTPPRSIFGGSRVGDTVGASVVRPTVGIFAAAWVPNDPRTRYHLRPAPDPCAPWDEVENACFRCWPDCVSVA